MRALAEGHVKHGYNSESTPDTTDDHRTVAGATQCNTFGANATLLVAVHILVTQVVATRLWRCADAPYCD